MFMTAEEQVRASILAGFGRTSVAGNNKFNGRYNVVRNINN